MPGIIHVRHREMKLLSGILCCLLVAVLAGCNGHGTDGTGSIETRNYANNTLKYYYYIPDSVRTTSEISRTFLVCIGGISRTGEDFVPSAARRLADEFGLIIIAPAFQFDEDNWEFQKSFQFPSAWSGAALMRIFDDFQSNHRFHPDKLLIFGGFAGADFAIRFSLLWPNQVKACAVYGSRAMTGPDISSDVAYFIGTPRNDKESRKATDYFMKKVHLLNMQVETREYSGTKKLPGGFTRDSIDFFRDSINNITRM